MALAVLPYPSPGILRATLAEWSVAYDLTTQTTHLLSPEAGWVLDLCDGEASSEGLVAEIAGITGGPTDDIAADVHAYLEMLSEIGLVGKRDGLTTPVGRESTSAADPAGPYTSAGLRLLTTGVVLRSNDAALLAQAEARVASLRGDLPITVTIDLKAQPGGAVTLTGGGPARSYASPAEALDNLPHALCSIATHTPVCLVLRSGCVRSPAGEVVLLPGPPESGATTLAAALVRLGWDYASDAIVGIQSAPPRALAYPAPLALSEESRRILRLDPSPSATTNPADVRADVTILHGPVGPVERVVITFFQAGARLHLEMLDPTAAVGALLEHALNLAEVGNAGLDIVCDLAQRVPVLGLVHSDINEAVAAVNDSSPRPGT